jgi:hypothetical protein
MLAYVFYHRAGEGADVSAYEEGLRRFHSALATAKPDGFITSATYRTADGYSDWYLLESAAALGVLNAAAVEGDTRPVHDAVARSAADFAGKLLTLITGRPDSQRFEIRFSKPSGTGYSELYERLAPITSRPEVCLWRRMMVLGPPPEFSLLSPVELALPADMRPEAFSLQVL